jgi:hypothetical protein
MFRKTDIFQPCHCEDSAGIRGNPVIRSIFALQKLQKLIGIASPLARNDNLLHYGT